MMDVVKKNGDKINTEELSRELGCKVVEISALKSTGIMEAADAAIDAAKNGKTVPMHTFSGTVEHTLAHIEEAAVHDMPEEQQRWYAIKLFERDDKVLEQIKLDKEVLEHIESDIKAVEAEMDDDAESIITNERYIYIGQIIKGCYKKKSAGKLSVSDKIDKVVTNRFAALPIFAVVMFLVYYISVSTVGTFATDWANDGVFGDGWHLFGIGSSAYDDAMTEYATQNVWTDKMISIVDDAAEKGVIGAKDLQSAIAEEDFGAFDEAYGSYADSLAEAGYDLSAIYDNALGEEAEGVPEPSEYGIWVPGIPVLAEKGLEAANTPEWLSSLLVDGIIGGVGALLGFEEVVEPGSGSQVSPRTEGVGTIVALHGMTLGGLLGDVRRGPLLVGAASAVVHELNLEEALVIILVGRGLAEIVAEVGHETVGAVLAIYDVVEHGEGLAVLVAEHKGAGQITSGGAASCTTFGKVATSVAAGQHGHGVGKVNLYLVENVVVGR